MAHPPPAPGVLLGRWLAICLHPHLAARVLPGPQRRLLIASWFVAGYVVALAVLLLVRP